MDQVALEELWYRAYAAVKSGSEDMFDLLGQFQTSMASLVATVIPADGGSAVQLELYVTDSAIVVNGVPKPASAKPPKVMKRAFIGGNPNFVVKDTMVIQLILKSSDLAEMTYAYNDLASESRGDKHRHQRKAAAIVARLELLPSYCAFVESRGVSLLEADDPRTWLVEETRAHFHEWLLSKTSSSLAMVGSSSVDRENVTAPPRSAQKRRGPRAPHWLPEETLVRASSHTLSLHTLGPTPVWPHLEVGSP